MIVIFGDSHCIMFCGQDATVVHVGPATAYGLANEKSATRSKQTILGTIASLGLKSQDTMVFVFGEIDCRIHIFRRSVLSGKAASEVIDDVVAKYLDSVALFQSVCGGRVIVLGAPPCSTQENLYSYDIYGPFDQRNRIVNAWNRKLEPESMKRGFTYIDIYYGFASDSGSAKPEFCDDGVHLNQKAGEFIFGKIKQKENNDTHSS